MATYYRWRKSGINYIETTGEDKNFYFFFGGLTLWYSDSKPDIVPNSAGYGQYHFDKSMVISSSNSPSVSGLFFGSRQNTSGMYKGNTNARAAVYTDDFGDQTIQIIGSAVSYKIDEERGDEIGYVYSTNINSYSSGGITKGYWYDQRTTLTSPTTPSNISAPNPIITPNVTVSWGAATSNVPDYPVNLYEVSYSVNGGSSWTVAGTTAGTSLEVDIPAGTTSILFRVRARDSNGQWGSYVTGTASQVLLVPTLTVPQMLMQGQQASVNWTAVEGADSYTLQRKANTDSDWTQVYSGANTTFSETAGTWTTVQYRVQAVFDGTPGGWATSAEIPVVSASALVISGQDGDLGTLVNDVPYSISTDTGNQITATITTNGAVIFSGNVGNSTAGVIPVLDLINGSGTIVIEASVTVSSGPVSAVRTWTYTKTMMTFPNAGSIAELTKDGKVMWPETLAEAVRIPGGKTLDQVMGFPCQIYTGSYVGTGTYGQSNPNTLTFPFEPKSVMIRGKPSYSAASSTMMLWWGGDYQGSEYSIKLVGTTLTWYDNNASMQNNDTNITYYYINKYNIFCRYFLSR